MRLPLQIGRASLNEGARFAACVWLGPVLLLIAAGFQKTWWFSAFLFGLPGLLLSALAFDAAEKAKADRASDILLDASGFSIAGGPLGGTTCAWSEVRSCEITGGETRTAFRWLVMSWLTGRRVSWVNNAARVLVKKLQIVREGHKEPLVLAEAEGDEIASLEQLRDSILGTIAPPGEPPPLPQEVLTCPSCASPQVPIDAPRMPCSSCGHEIDVPAELQQRVRASRELGESGGTPAALVQALVDQPSGRRAGVVIAAGRKLMVWIQPVAIGLWIAMYVHSTGWDAQAGGTAVVRVAPNDDGLFLYDLGLLALVVVGAFAIAWSVGHAYIGNRQALRMLVDHFGAVAPAKPGAASTCRHCSAPLPASSVLLVRCVYCATENVLGVDPRPAAMRHKQDTLDLRRALRRRRRAQLQRWFVIPLAALLGAVMINEVRIAWRVSHYVEGGDSYAGDCDWVRCGSLTNEDRIRRTVTFEGKDGPIETTLLPHGKIAWRCVECTIDVARVSFAPPQAKHVALRIAHGRLQPLAP